MKNILPLLAITCLALSGLGAQTQGRIHIEYEAGVEPLVKKFVELNKATEFINGWRIQLLATTDRVRMEDALRNFKFLYPHVPVDWVHSKPYYKIRAGAFARKQDAIRLLYLLKQDYPAAYPAQDDRIRPEELLLSSLN
ncbi:MAG: SPOR domain-containing protein [Bacteroidetes bacterium]|nr:MAG: SPOR domain-containing protein [Bacteroidota bacterium]